MPDSPKYSGSGPHGTVPAFTGKSREQMMAEFKAKMKEPQDPIRYLLGENPDPKRVAEVQARLDREPKPAPVEKPKHQMGPKDYPWMRPGWRG